MKDITIKLQISEEAFQLLLDIEKAGYAEYRDTEYSCLEDFIENRDINNKIKTKEWFLNRNFNGTYYLIGELLEYDFIDLDFDAWHTTYKVTEFGKKVIKQNI